MATIKRFEDLIAWQKARVLNKEVYTYLLVNRKVSIPLKNQLDGAAGSIMDNIAEGFAREGNKEFRQFLTFAKGSCSEVKSQLYRAYDRNFISSEVYNNLTDLSDETSKTITGLIKYLNRTDFKGNKFKVSEDEIIYFNASNSKLETD